MVRRSLVLPVAGGIKLPAKGEGPKTFAADKEGRVVGDAALTFLEAESGCLT
jgi:hypothetical protein